MTHTDIDIPYLIEIARSAGREIMKVYQRDFTVDYKADHSPLTEADHLANDIIVDQLSSRYPHSNLISEENKQLSYEERRSWTSFWLIDPLDGTKEFIKKNGEFTVNIALIEDGIPTFGIVYAPVPDILYYGIKSQGSFKIGAGTSTRLKPYGSYLDRDIVRVLASRSHMSYETQAFVSEITQMGKTADFLSIGSSLKLCLVAEGVADIYPRFAPTMEWDTAAGHAVVIYAGRQVLEASTRQPLVYNKPSLLNPSFLVF